MCEETGREGRELENKWIYVLVLFVTITCCWFKPDAQLFFFVIIKTGLHLLIFLENMSAVIVAVHANSEECT